jgi:AcrR family transcriptional regulator
MGEATKRRAPGMSVEQRRAMIIAAALPLVAEYGAAVTTSKVARAAGIGEATIFRAFADKEELLDACMAEVLRSDHAVRELGSIPLDQPLAARLVEAADALAAHLARMGAMAGALQSSGHRSRAREDGGRGERAAPVSRAESMAVIRAAVADLFEPGDHALRVDADEAAAIFLGLLFTRPRLDETGGGLSSERLVDVFLHGALTADGA